MIIYVIVYALISVGGLIFVKMGSTRKLHISFTSESFQLELNWLTLLGLLLYIASFIIYMTLISKNRLSYVVPLATAIVYILTLASAYFVFKEHLSLFQYIGCALIILGALLIQKK